MSQACAAGSPCPVEADSNGPGGSEVLPTSGLADGTHWLIVASLAAGQCGPVTLQFPFLPVELQNFSVE